MKQSIKNNLKEFLVLILALIIVVVTFYFSIFLSNKIENILPLLVFIIICMASTMLTVWLILGNLFDRITVKERTKDTKSNMKIILISGKAQNGKDTTAKMLKDKLEQQDKRVLVAHYGDLVKYVCKTFFDWNGEKDNAGRTLLQYVGTDIIRKKYPHFWVDFIKSILIVFDGYWDYVLIPDTRFPNEINGIKAEFGTNAISLRISRNNFESPLTEAQQQHISETALDDYKFNYYLSAADFS
jgi:hypothetical protein